jgi:stearoyl-CoA desaturase (Delta-9 desaturase)
VATCLGITVGFHRLLTHRSFQTYPAVRYGLAVLGTLAVEGSVIKWVADHRRHHAFADQDGDPPEVGVPKAAQGSRHAGAGAVALEGVRTRYAPVAPSPAGSRS